MKSISLVLLLALVVLSATGARAQQPKGIPTNITVLVEGYEMSRRDAPAVPTQGNAEAKAALEKVESMAAKDLAKVISLPAISTRSGQRAVVKSKSSGLDVSAVLGPDGTKVSMSISVTQGAQLVKSNVTLSMGETALMGTLEVPGRDRVQMFFVRVFAQRAQ